MLLIRKQKSILLGCVLTVFLFVLQTNAAKASPYHYENKINKGDTVVPNYGDSLKYPIRDRRGDFLGSGNGRTIDLKNPSNIKDSVVYDPATRRYIVYEKIGTKYYRTTTSYSFDEYWQIKGRQSENEYFGDRQANFHVAIAPWQIQLSLKSGNRQVGIRARHRRSL